MPTQSPSQRVAANIRAEMARSNVTQKALAERLDRSQQSLSLRLTGQVSFSVDELTEIAQALSVSLANLIGEAVA